MSVKDLRLVLLTKIMSAEGVFAHKYSSNYNTLKAIIELEKKEKEQDMLPKSFFDRFDDIKKMTTNLDPKIKGFPMLIVQEYFIRNSANLDKYIYMTYGKDLESASELKVMELYEILEDFFFKIYLLAVQISDFYKLEIKLKKDNTKLNNEDFF